MTVQLTAAMPFAISTLRVTRGEGFARVAGDYVMCVDSNVAPAPGTLSAAAPTAVETDTDVVRLGFTRNRNAVHQVEGMASYRFLCHSNWKVSFVSIYLYNYRETLGLVSRKINVEYTRAGYLVIKELEKISVPNRMPSAWNAKLIRAIFTADSLAGMGIGDGQAEAHRLISREIAETVRLDGDKSLKPFEKAKVLLLRFKIYRPVRRLLKKS